MKQIMEGKAKINIYEGKISRELPVFYNPVMALNRDISVALLKTLPGRMTVLDLLAGSGVRAVRLLKELPKGKVAVTANDASAKAVEAMKQHAKMNKVKFGIASLSASKLFANAKAFDYIDIDPFGSPNPFLDQSIQHLSRRGILAVTATDTAALAGAVPKACERKYWAKPLRNFFMHETALRILIRKIQLIGAQYERALTPIVSYASHHYYRVFFRSEKGRQKADKLLEQHGYLSYCNKCMQANTNCCSDCKSAGPLWLGQLWDERLLQQMIKNSPETSKEFIETLAKESKINTIGFLDIHEACRTLHISAPQTGKIIKAIKKTGNKVAQTHFSPTGLRTTMKGKEFLRLMKGI